MMELTPESSNNSLREPSPNGRKASDSDSLVDDPHEGWVIPYDQADSDGKHVSIAGQTDRRTDGSTTTTAATATTTHGCGADRQPLNQNVEDTRL